MNIPWHLLVLLAGQADGWKLDTLHRPGRESLRGLVVRQGADAIEFKQVVRKPGSPTLVFALSFKPSEVSGLDLIDDADRAELTRKLEKLENDRRLLFAHLRRVEKGAIAEDLQIGRAHV